MAHPSPNSLVWQSFRYFLRANMAVALGIAAATAVITGALVVGDSVRGSLRKLVEDRLANVELLMTSRHFFDTKLVESIQTDASHTVVPLILLPSSSAQRVVPNQYQGNDVGDSIAQQSETGRVQRASRVQILAIDDRFTAALDSHNRKLFEKSLQADQIVINESLARELDAQVGDQITLSLSTAGGIPGDNLLGHRDKLIRNLPRQQVVQIVSDQSIGAIQFISSQEAPFNVFTSLAGLQDFLDLNHQANAAMVFTKESGSLSSAATQSLVNQLNQQIKPTLEDFSLQLMRNKRVFPDLSIGEQADSDPVTIYDYYQISSTALLIDSAVQTAIVKALGEKRCTQVLAFLANSIEKVDPGLFAAEPTPQSGRTPRGFGFDTVYKRKQPSHSTVGRKVPYSIVVGISDDSPLLAGCYTIAYDYPRFSGCLVNSWLANELQVEAGDRIQIEFYEPETVDSVPQKSYTTFRVSKIVPVETPIRSFRRQEAAKFGTAPTVYNDPHLTPTVPGVTDQASISNWDLPFELELRDQILKQDDKYWDDFRLAPKIFLPLTHLHQIFGSRFGNVTSIHIASDHFADESQLRQQVEPALRLLIEQVGMTFKPVRQQQMQAATGTTPFDWLFLSLSSFVIVAALLLVTLLFKLSIQQRASQLGTLIAQGFQPGTILAMHLKEYLLIALMGAGLGLPLGLVYARLLIAGLESWWIGAISASFLEFKFTASSMLIGWLAGILASVITISANLQSIAKQNPLSLLRGVIAESSSNVKSSSFVDKNFHGQPWLRFAPAAIAAVAALLLSAMAATQSGMIQAGSFFGSGMLLLTATWLAIRQLLQQIGPTAPVIGKRFSALAWSAIGRNPLRSSLSIGLLAIASFLIASMGVFHVTPSHSGYGGFDLIGVSSQPIFINMGSAAVRSEAVGTIADDLKGSAIIPLRMREGDDASCTNLFQPAQPTILGLPPTLQRLTESSSGFEFSWAANKNPNSPWDELQKFSVGSKYNPIPVILDQNTALWSLKQGGKLGATIELTLDNVPLHFVVIGLLNNSVLQGKLIIGEKNFQTLFPQINGYRFFLVSCGSRVDPQKATTALETGWSSEGFDVTSSHELLQRLLAVQNTYISAFQTLGALGLLLGTLGLIAVQLRSIWERRSELALMQAIGFSGRKIGTLLTIETLLLLGIGLLVGIACSAVALLPYVWRMGPQLVILQPLLMLAGVFACGLFSALIAVRAALRLPLLSSLRRQ